ncbi:YdeI/OmpD-associated family protein [Pararhodobacter sp. SW119]|uniref:YdeI/OmpD-associated family protein n=1 Tax=Pararhodobacter sp. SW119 TaxID=2780075 RepID=UPI001ADF7D8B|nr:YdeI/OmpD-associated family protein [Pararhodobacter sp. SW119]
MITELEDYFTRGCGRCARFDTADCSTRKWAAGLAALRRICRDLGLDETVKWGHPCYRHADRNIAVFGAFRGDFRLSFMNAALLADPEGILEPAGPNAQVRSVLRFTDAAEVAQREPVLRAYLAEAMAHARAGTKSPKTKREIDLPDELVAALDADPALGDAFHNLTPGRQRSYVVNLSGAQKSTTRMARIARFRDRILAGKGATER